MDIAAIVAEMPPNSDVLAIAARIRAAIPWGVELPGDPLEMAEQYVIEPTVQRIGQFTDDDIDRLTSHWRKFDWQILVDEPHTPAENLATDEVLCDRIGRTPNEAVLRFWKWTSPAIVLGRSQSLANEINVELAVQAGYQIVRRLSGGGTMVIDPINSITYSLIVPDSAFAELTLRQSYELADAFMIQTLRSLGYDAHHIPINDIGWRGGKIGGSAQARRRGAILHHATIACAFDASVLGRILRLGQPRVNTRGVGSAVKVVSPLSDQFALPSGKIEERYLELFQRRFHGRGMTLTPEDLAGVRSLVASKYGSNEWLHEIE